MSEDAPPQHPRLRLSLHKGFKSPTAHSPSPTPFRTPRSGKAPSQDAAEAAQVQASWSFPVYLRPGAGFCLPVSPRPLGDAGSIHWDRPSCQGGLREVHPCTSIHPFPAPPMASTAPAFPDLSHVNPQSGSKHLPSCSQPKKRKGKKGI